MQGEAMEKMLDSLKMLLGMKDSSDPELDEKLIWILESAGARLKVLLGGLEPPDEMSHIIVEVSVIRYNRIGSEGIGSHTVEGESMTFSENDFAGFSDEIEAFLDLQKEAKRGRVRFL